MRDRLMAGGPECARMERELSHYGSQGSIGDRGTPRGIGRYQERAAGLADALHDDNPEHVAAVIILCGIADRHHAVSGVPSSRADRPRLDRRISRLRDP